MTLPRGALLTLGGALFCVLAVATLSGPYAWLYERLFGHPDYAMHDLYFVALDPLLMGLTFAGLTALVLMAGKARSPWITTIALAATPLVILYAPMLASGFPYKVSFRGMDAAVLTAGLLWSFLLRRLAR